MHIKCDHAELCLGIAEPLRIYDAAGAIVHCKHGSIWITQLGDSRDYCLCAGGSLVLQTHELVLLRPLNQSEVVISSPAENKTVPANISAAIRDVICKTVKGVLACARATRCG